jgi:hypothetical protein
MDFKKGVREDVDWRGPESRSSEHGRDYLDSTTYVNFLSRSATLSFSRITLLHLVIRGFMNSWR